MGDPYTWSISLSWSRWTGGKKLKMTGDMKAGLKDLLINFYLVNMKYLWVIFVLGGESRESGVRVLLHR